MLVGSDGSVKVLLLLPEGDLPFVEKEHVRGWRLDSADYFCNHALDLKESYDAAWDAYHASKGCQSGTPRTLQNARLVDG